MFMASSAVVGLGRSGIGAARLLHAQGHRVTVLESQQSKQQQRIAEELMQLGINVRLGCALSPDPFLTWDEPLDQVVLSPGIAWDHPVMQGLRDRGIAVCGEMTVAWNALGHVPWIGITGTNGKTTVTHLLHHVLSHAGLKAPMAGNVGHSAADLALQYQQPSQEQPDWVVMEMSSYQIEAAQQVAPQIGIWTTLTPDHLERHGTLEAYRAIKASLLQRSTHAVLNGDDPDLRQHHSAWPDATWVSTHATPPVPCALRIDADDWVCSGVDRLFRADALALPGDHNRQNMLLVTAAALRTGLKPSTIEAGLRSFSGVPHRLEPLGLLQGMAVFNDSKATNYDAAAVGLRAVDAPAVVLAGGQTKQGDSREWLKLLNERACGIVLFGHGAEELHRLITASGYTGTLQVSEGLDTALPLACRIGTEQRAACLLLSPACASFDQYSDFEARGDHFRRLVNALQTH
jgi:UDP-N-acetylmuramoylalanine--D-glutamate ligase